MMTTIIIIPTTFLGIDGITEDLDMDLTQSAIGVNALKKLAMQAPLYYFCRCFRAFRE